jgi:hypothetical protein
MAPIERDDSLRVRMSREETEWAKWCADQAGLTVSDLIRQLLRREYMERSQSLANRVLEKSKTKSKRK